MDCCLSKENSANINIYDIYGRPGKNLTKENWQNVFEEMKMSVKSGKSTFASSQSVKPKDELSNYATYCAFLSNAQRCIKQNQGAFLFFGYQIWDLLFRFKSENLIDELACDYSPENECYIMYFKSFQKKVFKNIQKEGAKK